MAAVPSVGCCRHATLSRSQATDAEVKIQLEVVRKSPRKIVKTLLPIAHL